MKQFKDISGGLGSSQLKTSSRVSNIVRQWG
ncbi:hypothetical protein F441_01867 [Phytophthora nicotianae CJ01A1]|uniref:Uncharacterized protein n=4 Tax=Phytophthora nicotianae TaxID=4792 RepID=W2QSA1_PHYN3|nr:hypothetical protein PPTG_21999 [Phytophthora nicotianae INRA-310]ETI55396.1 hypothetical protein F443_01907 [Phytophthora nicotianae P1569]ETN15801.1 hypothetical protein PPTG_21999 [Phytophthora nicotianae INRA-310]ETO84151.1 hypothetical protein F444_01912 [Phytophthora nicotianae P1976]ETP25240.1 hypothetical protein F441_01867 [Phytophthora nicotianae CJ01A1]